MRSSGQKGAVAPLIAVLLLVILVSVALVVDLGHVHSVKVQLQRAVDSAALAGARYLPEVAEVKAVAIAAGGENKVGYNTITISADDVITGTWDKDDFSETASVRFSSTTVNPDAVYVRATRVVDHVFFSLFIDSTTVTADAIAVSEPVNPILPLALVSCIPLDSVQNNPGTQPGVGPCDIKYYSYSPDKDDTAAWTSLTFGANANDIVKVGQVLA